MNDLSGPTQINSSHSAVRQLNRLVWAVLTESAASMELSFRLAQQNIRARYRKSLLGILWAMLPPLVITAGFTLANRSDMFRVGETALPYPIYVLIGIVLWQLFAECLEGPYNALESARSYITRVTFPREAFLSAQFLEILFSATIRLTISLCLAIGLGIVPVSSMLLFPIVGMAVLILGFSIGLFIAPALILFGDSIQALRLFVTYGLFLTPVVYPPPTSGLFYWIVTLNPVTPLMMSARESLIDWNLSYPIAFIGVLAASLAMLAAGVLLMRIALPFLLERMLVGGR